MRVSQVVHTLTSGYRSLLRRIIEMVASVIALALISSIITLPIWLLATGTPLLFNWLIALLLFSAILFLIRRGRVGRPANNGTAVSWKSRLPVPAATIVATGLVTWGVLDRLPVVSVIGVVVLSMLYAWRRGRSR